MTNIVVKKGCLDGVICVPSSKSVAHRMIISSAISGNRVEINGNLKSKDILATLDCINGMGVTVEPTDEGVLLDATHLNKASCSFDVNESGSTMRFMLPLLPVFKDGFHIDGKGRIHERPVTALKETMERAGVSVENGFLPTQVKGRYNTNSFSVDASDSSQYVTGLLFTLVALGGGKLKVEKELSSKGYVDITIDVLKRFGAEIDFKDNVFTVSVNKENELPTVMEVDGDWSSACFWVVGGAICGKTIVKGLRYPDCQPDSIIISVMEQMGAKIYLDNDLLVTEKSKLKAIDFDADGNPDIVPILAVACAYASGVSTITGTRRLRIKESDRVQAVCDLLSECGVKVEAGENYIKIWGSDTVKGGIIDSQNDHRIAMSGVILGSASQSETVIKGIECTAKSYPDFLVDFKRIGGIYEEL